jgi:hypothetical protein
VYSAQHGYLARPPDYDGVGYLYFAEAPYHLLLGLHLKQAAIRLDDITPLWTALLTAHYLALGQGVWQAFAARFWAVALLLVLVWWVVRRRAPWPLAAAAVVLTVLLPMVSAGVRSASWELASGLANYNEDWGLDDLRPDLLVAVLVLWSAALVVEGESTPARWRYLRSAVFAAAAVLVKPSTAPVSLAAWGVALALGWLAARRDPERMRSSLYAIALFVLVVLPWATVGRGVVTTAGYFYEAAVAYKGAYAMNLDPLSSAAYYIARIPAQVGQLEALPVAVAAVLLAVALWRRRLGVAELTYGVLVLLFYAAFTATSNKNPHVGEWVSLALWLFVLAGASRLAAARWVPALPRLPAAVLAAAVAYAVLVYAAGAAATAAWPANETRADAHLVAVTDSLAGELDRHVGPKDCFSYAPGPGWPASLQLLLRQRDGATAQSTPIDVDPTATSIDAYLATAKRCPAIVVYRDDIKQVAKVFFCPPVRQPYLQALSDWVRSPGSGYSLSRSWTMTDLPPVGAHPLGRYDGVTLTVELYVRSTQG